MAAKGIEKAFCVLMFHECRSVTIVQRQFSHQIRGKNRHLTIPFEGMYAQLQEADSGVCVKGKPSPADMLQTVWKNWIITLSFVESQTVHI
jgi:hypothetical protein